MKKVFTITGAKAQFSKLLRRVAAGEEITITKRGVPVARLVPVETQKGKRQLGFYEGKFTARTTLMRPPQRDSGRV